jgi:NAD(P)-dependent dehydrogenase (short-subunit alcohol dehydrogenase family)
VNLKTVLVDLSDLKSVRDAVGEIGMLVREAKGSGGKGIDGLFNNAGINSSQRRLTKEGVELQFGTNHLGPFLLTNLLMPLLLVNEGGSRIVMTSSEVHRISPMRFSD